MNNGMDRRDPMRRWTPEEVWEAQRAIQDEEIAKQLRDQAIEKWLVAGFALLVMFALVAVLWWLVYLNSH